MPSLKELIDAEGYYELGTIDGTMYCWMDIVVAMGTDGTVTPVCMKDDWERTLPARLIEAQERIGDLHTDLMYAKENHAATAKELQAALERANRATWLESEVARLTHDLERYRLSEAVGRGMSATIYDQHQLSHQRACDAECRCRITGVYTIDPCDCVHCSEVRQAYQAMDRLNRPATNSHIAPEAPIFRKLCQCDACREIRIHSGVQTAEIEGH